MEQLRRRSSGSGFRKTNTLFNQSPWGTGWLGWLSTLWPLLAHLILSIPITTFVVYYVNNNYFNLHVRLPWTSLVNANGERIQWGRWAPLQSDITTLISASLVLLRWVVVAWSAALNWRCIFLLMGSDGLRSQRLRQIIRYQLLFPYASSPLTLLIGATLLINLMAQSMSPVLTGAISWVPSNTPARRVTNATINVPVAFQSDEWLNYHDNIEWRKRVTVQASGLVTSAWQPDEAKGALKRALHGASGLNVNSTIANVTLPYFSITSLEWISNVTQGLSSYQRNVEGYWRYVGVGDGTAPVPVANN
ncbi:hypothetical protein RSOLAG22IIIB_06472 [Rhizoctonia solani]|uniref:Uncharacterized protein n=1 Tax=Rhizoctonia solani TaxID=456999 RepID=A0A0K6GEY1_9AGAM|nr:hypothetical protein RSOLAG22IIIB_06472 [Rhizoctonia solani]